MYAQDQHEIQDPVRVLPAPTWVIGFRQLWGPNPGDLPEVRCLDQGVAPAGERLRRSGALFGTFGQQCVRAFLQNSHPGKTKTDGACGRGASLDERDLHSAESKATPDTCRGGVAAFLLLFPMDLLV